MVDSESSEASTMHSDALNDGNSSSGLRVLISHNLPPLQVTSTTSTVVRKSSTGVPNLYKSELKELHGSLTPLSPGSEKTLRCRIEELSQLNSPLLRELARRLGSVYKIETPPQKETFKAAKDHPYADIRVGDRWQEIQGSTQWAGLLDPIDPVIKSEILRYGEFAQATYDAFDRDRKSTNCGNSRYSKQNLLEKLGLGNRGYEITEFLYATTGLLADFLCRPQAEPKWSKDSNWIGFVAVCTSPKEIERLGRRDILVAWRGTRTTEEWLKDVLATTSFMVAPSSQSRSGVKVHSGFLSIYSSSNRESRYNKTSARDQVRVAVKKLVEKYWDAEKRTLSITMTGHSLGSALATICGCDIAEQFSSEKIPVSVYSFAGPRVGNSAFCDKVRELGVNVLRVVNVRDLVPKVPGILHSKHVHNPNSHERLRHIHQLFHEVKEKFSNMLPIYQHVGVKFKVDNLKSHFLQETMKMSLVHMVEDYLSHLGRNSKDRVPIICSLTLAHSLEGYLHLVDGYHSSTDDFKPTWRDIALVNKGGNFLKHRYLIPANWWHDDSTGLVFLKGLVRDQNGLWILPPRDSETL